MALLSDEDLECGLRALPGWVRDGDAIVKQFEFVDFKESIAFVNRVTPVAEEMNHHPDLLISWNTVTASVSTHAEGGLTANDLELAARIDPLA